MFFPVYDPDESEDPVRSQRPLSQSTVNGGSNGSLAEVSKLPVVPGAVIPVSISGSPTVSTHICVDANSDPLTQLATVAAAQPPVCASSPMAAPTTALVNGYLSDPPPLIPQGNILHRPIINNRQFKSAQPTHTAPGMHKNVINMPGLHSAIHSMPHHSFVAPPVVTTTSTQGQLVLGPANHQANNNNVLQQQPPQTHQLAGMPSEAHLNSFHAAYPQLAVIRPPSIPGAVPQQRGILTSIANTAPAAMTTTQSQPGPVGPPLSHSPSPVATAVSNDQGQSLYLTGNSDVTDPRLVDRGNTGTPPTQAPPHMVNKSASGTNTPSPPLTQQQPPVVGAIPPIKQHSANCLNCEPTTTQPSSNSGNQQIFFHQIPPAYLYQLMSAQPPNNGLVTTMPPFLPPQGQGYPNGISPEVHQYISAAAAHARFPQQLAQNQFPPHMASAYGNSYPPHNQGVAHSNLQTGMPPPAPVNTGLGQGPSNNGMNNKIACYNCGNAGHKAAECREKTIENISS